MNGVAGGGRSRGRTGMVLRGYSPLIGLTIVIALLVGLVPSKRSEGAIGAGGSIGGVGVTATTAPTGDPGSAVPLGVSKGNDCAGGERQTVEPYSPPCLKFTGDNGGGTYNGVTKDTITVAFREGNLPSLYAVAGQVAQRLNIKDTNDDVQRTIKAYFDYFNKNFQLYGRKAEVKFYKGQGDQLQEFFGGNPEAATADAITVAQEVKALADLSVLTVPYAEALVRQKVMAIPPIHMSRGWYEKHAPYTWGVFVDCTRLVETILDYGVKRLFGKPAIYAGDPSMRTQKRKFAVITPEQPWYKECVDDGLAKLEKEHNLKIDFRLNYKLDFSRLSTDAPNIVAQLKARGITTVACGCDPILPLFMGSQATQQNYNPEWFVAATALTDVDLIGQIYDTSQWRHAFGLSFLGDIYQGSKAESYRAYKSIRPDDEPAFIHDVLYYPVLLFFLGVHMAGPNLTPEAFQKGLFSMPPIKGETGTWSFGPGDYTATDDAREIYWDPKAISPFNNAPGRYVTALDGQRFFGNAWPEGQPQFPIKP